MSESLGTPHARITRLCEQLRDLAEKSTGDEAFNTWTETVKNCCAVITINAPVCPPSCGDPD